MAGGAALAAGGGLGDRGKPPFGVLVALLLARGRFPGRQGLSGLVHLPLVLLPVVTGYALLPLFGRSGPLGALLADRGVVLAFRWTGAALARAVMGFPLMVRAIWLSVEAVDPEPEEAAATLGAGRAWTSPLVTLPLIAPGIVAGAILAVLKAMGEFGATSAFAPTSPARPRPSPRPSARCCRCRAARTRRCGSSRSRSPWPWGRSPPRNGSAAGWRGGWPGGEAPVTRA